MSTGAWVAWGITTAIGIAALVVAFFAWRRPNAPEPTPVIPPDLRVEKLGGIGSSAGPSPYVKAKLELANADDAGTARGWQVSIGTAAGVKVAKLHRRGPPDIGSTVRWQQDPTTSEIPPAQARDLEGWLWVEGSSADMGEVALPLTVKADAMPTKTGVVVVTFPSSGVEAAVRFELVLATGSPDTDPGA